MCAFVEDLEQVLALATRTAARLESNAELLFFFAANLEVSIDYWRCQLEVVTCIFIAYITSSATPLM
jgi:hypothetical protein